jgi:hypothetical protein
LGLFMFCFLVVFLCSLFSCWNTFIHHYMIKSNVKMY